MEWVEFLPDVGKMGKTATRKLGRIIFFFSRKITVSSAQSSFLLVSAVLR